MSDAEQKKSTQTAPEQELPKEYNAREVEARWYKRWEDAGVFHPDAKKTLEDGVEPYVIMMPPPNVTGSLHNGHALFVTIEDILTRFWRMKGKNTLWLPGVDHAGIATQAVVERELRRHEGLTRHDLGREKFLERVWAWKEKNGSRIVEQLKVLGASADWERERFTMDAQCSKAVNEAFVRMWNDDLIFRGERLINWDPITRTAVSNEEVDHEERDGELWSFAYALKDGGGEIVVATTRPETMLGDTAVAVHPDDERYTELVGKELVHPFFPERKLPVIADKYVDMAFGSGAVKITPAHDPNDYEIGLRHELEMINIFNLDATLNSQGGPYAGLDRYEARKRVKADLEAQGFFRGSEKIKHNVSISQRSHEPIEPMLSRQYFVKGEPLAKLAIDAVNSGETRIIPESWKATWDHFMNNIRDWCVSRQLWWGHRIPVYYDLKKLDEAIEVDAGRKKGQTEALKAQADGVAPKDLLQIALATLDDDLVRGFSVASTEDLAAKDPERYTQEEDVLDTWFSSGLWPFSTLGWPEETDDLKAFYPGACLETGFDILFFWVARMMMMGCYFMGKAPFKDVYLHAMVRDSRGEKMSKSKGNAIDPLDVVDGINLEDLLAKTKTYPVPEKNLKGVLKWLEKEFKEHDGIPASGADGLRFSLAALSGQGRDVKLALSRVAGYRAFLNKIWNATRFALMRVGDAPVPALSDVKADLSLADRWILSRLQEAVSKVDAAVQAYRFDDLANVIYQFFWTEFCDWYIELSKANLFDDAEPRHREATRAVLVHVLDTAMRLLHPVCPFQSEEIWQRLPGRQERWPQTAFCAVAPFPKADPSWTDPNAEAEMELFMSTVTLARNARQESGLGAQQKVDAILLSDDEKVRAALERASADLIRIAKLKSVQVFARDAYDVPRFAALNATGQLEVIIPLEGLIDLNAETERLKKDLAKTEKERDSLDKRLSSPKFVERAPAEVVAESKAQLASLNEKCERLNAALKRIAG